jgi:hypothetical protein
VQHTSIWIFPPNYPSNFVLGNNHYHIGLFTTTKKFQKRHFERSSWGCCVSKYKESWVPLWGWAVSQRQWT